MEKKNKRLENRLNKKQIKEEKIKKIHIKEKKQKRLELNLKKKKQEKEEKKLTIKKDLKIKNTMYMSMFGVYTIKKKRIKNEKQKEDERYEILKNIKLLILGECIKILD